MGELKRVSPILATMIVVAIAAAASLVGLGRQNAGSGRLVSLPATVDEASVIGALAKVGIGDAVGSSTALVPLSDFSRVVAIAFQGANLRAPRGDPRRTPLLDELERRFTVTGPDGAPWRVLYVPDPTRARDAAAAAALDGLGTPWAWDLPPVRGNGSFLWLPASAWAIWLVARKPRRGRLGRAVIALSWLPLLPGATLARGLLFVVLEAATMTADRALGSASGSRTSRSRVAISLWPYALAVTALAAIEPVSLAYIAASIPFLWVLACLRPGILRRVRRGSMHEPPAFKSLTSAGVLANARGIAGALPLPIAAMLAVFLLVPARGGGVTTGRDPFRIERGRRHSSDYAESLLKSQLDYQYAITFGRIGDVAWGEGSYKPVYRYREEDGRMRLTEEPDEARSDWPPGTFDAAKAALTFYMPVSIGDGGKNQAAQGESALH
ncbi:MAG: hypothetical protein CVV47_17005 [Spirochaetae bacterium HGW-Spirochaetae-3]|nr:MAG: hypothetical protein CVV47_17005 [Spirochaetae bacterium HGW-Spirochaetae-3]